MGYNNVFGGGLIFPSQTSYLAISTAVDVTLQWPIEQQIAGINVVADFMDVTTTAGAVNIDMPDAQQTSIGQKATFSNPGANLYNVRDSTGGAIQAVAAGEQWVLVLSDNTTAAGTWLTFQMGASVSTASAAALNGAGIKAISTTLNQMIDSDVEASTPFTVVDADRANCLIYTSGAGTCNLPSPAAVGNDWFFMLRNSGSGTLNIVPPSGDIDGSANINLDPNQSCFIFTDGTDFFTVGLSTSSVIAFDFVSLAIAGSGDFTLSGANLNRISYRFTGVLTGDRKIVVPNTTQQYWVDNQTTGAFALTVGTSAQVGEPEVTQGTSEIFYCDSTDVVNAVSAASVSFPISVAQGGTGATTVGGAQTALDVPPNTRNMIAGGGLTGGGDFSADRTFDIGAGQAIVVNANDVDVQVATTAQLGVQEVATQTEVDAGADAGRWVTPNTLAGWTALTRGFQTVVATGDTTIPGVAFVDTPLSISLEANARYAIDYYCAFATASGSGDDTNLRFTGQSVSWSGFSVIVASNTAGNEVDELETGGMPGSTTLINSDVASSTFVTGSGVIETDATPGVWKLQMAKSADAGADGTFFQESWLRAQRLS